MSKPQTKDNVLVSIIVPVYNIEEYIEKCVDSLLAQTYANIEILLIDDGSNDKSSTICDKTALQDTRVCVIHKKNGGLSDARNVGISMSRGQYIAFVDGDDYVHKNYIKTLLNAAQRYQADISVCSYIRVYSDGSKAREGKREQVTQFSNIQAIRDLTLPNSLCDVVAWNKLYSRRLFIENSIRYPLGKVNEDTFTTYKLLYGANRIVFLDEPLYFYVQRSSSIMGVGYTSKNLAIVEAIDEMLLWAGRKRLPIQNEVFYYRLYQTLYLIGRMADANMTASEDWKLLGSWLSRNKKDALIRNKHVNRTQKVIICFILLGRRPYLLARWLLRHTPHYDPLPQSVVKI
jgi:glycosyltransferase involved in cell wall biosynthesis